MTEQPKDTGSSLCWFCRRVGIECRKPVPGWDADYNPLHTHNEDPIPSWFVRACPEFEADRTDVQFAPKKKPTKLISVYKTPPRKHYIFGEHLTLDQISKKYGVKKTTIQTRMRRGMTLEEAIDGRIKHKDGKRYDIFGESLTAREVSELYGVKPNTFRTRITRGMSPEEAAMGGRHKNYILIGSCVETGEVRQWFTVNEACGAGLGFNPPGISASVNHGLVHKGWIFEKKSI